MPRRRMIDPSIWDDPEVGELTPTEFKLFVGCISLADDEGRLDADPRMLRKQMFGYSVGISVEDVAGWRDSMAQKLPNVTLYAVGDGEYIALRQWDKHQTINANWKVESKLPAPPCDDDSGTCGDGDEMEPITCTDGDEMEPGSIGASNISKQYKQVNWQEGQESSSKQARDTPAAAAFQAMRAFGISQDIAQELSTREDATPERITACWERVQARDDVRFPAKMLERMIRDGDSPPRPPPDEREKFKVISPGYEHIVKH